MMHSNKKIIASVLALAASGFCHADNSRGFYAGGNFGITLTDDFIITETQKPDAKLRMGTLEVLGGYKYNAFLGIDVRVGTGLVGKTVEVSDTVDADYDLGSYYAVYYRPEMINDYGSWYGLLGYSNVDYSVEIKNANGEVTDKLDESKSGMSFGFGVAWFLQNNVNFHIEARSLINSDDISGEIVTAGFDYRF